MALRKSRFFHSRTPSGRYHGFSVLLQPNDDSTKVNLSVSFCSKKDQFCRKTGRDKAAAARVEVIPVVELPNKLREFMDKALGFGDREEWLTLKQRQLLNNRYAWIWKYFL